MKRGAAWAVTFVTWLAAVLLSPHVPVTVVWALGWVAMLAHRWADQDYAHGYLVALRHVRHFLDRPILPGQRLTMVDDLEESVRKDYKL
jgi:hypothetical protein